MKTLFEEEYARSNPTPCYSIIHRKAGSMHASTFYSFEQASPYDLDRYAEEIYLTAKAVDIPVIASINCISDLAWVDYSLVLAEAGAAAIELNRSCPYSAVLLGGQDSWVSLAAGTVELVKAKVSIPLCVKLTPQLSDPALTAGQLEKSGADGLVMFSRFTGLDIDLETEKPVMHGGFAGHGGPWSLHYALRWIAGASPRVKLPISASGGVCCGEDVIKFILAGAASVQLCTSIYLEGFRVIDRFLGSLLKYMEQKGYSSIEQFRGAVCGKILSAAEVDRNRNAVAIIEAKSCDNCGICFSRCLHGAVKQQTGQPVIEEKVCTGCGLCVQLCPRSAIYMAGAIG